MSTQPLVSILMTAYNREKYIRFAIESVLASTYKNWELVIVDDGSKDKTLEIINVYARIDNRIKVFVNEKNIGDYPNRNMAASYASGKYLKYIDADDYIYPSGLEVLVSMMEQFPEAGWGLCSLEQDIFKPFPFELSPENAYKYHYAGPGLFHKAPLSSIIKKAVFTELGGFAALRMVGDYEMWHRLAQKYNVVLMPHGIVWYREHNEQELNEVKKFTAQYEDISNKYLLDHNCPLNKELAEIIRANLKRKKILQSFKNFFKGRF